MNKYNFFKKTALILFTSCCVIGCQKMEKPALADYPKDTNPPGGPLKLFVAFDGTTADPIMNAVDSIRANFPSDNPLASIEGVSGKGVQGEAGKYIKYAKPNDWASTAKAFTVACWYKKNGQTKNNLGTNGPEYLVSFRASPDNYNWSNGNFLFFFEGDNTACGVKFYIASASGDGWITWENAGAIAGLLDNKWHHIAGVYNNTNSTMTLYIDGVAYPQTRTWGTHGDLNLDDSKIAEVRIGRGPRNDGDGDGAGGWLQSSWKGGLDQFRLYNAALTAAEVKALFDGKK
jgi:hypothetical protein